MRRRWLLPLLLGPIAAIAAAAAAEDCFCLVNPSTGAILRGCAAFKAPTDYSPTAVCPDPVTGRTSEPPLDTSGRPRDADWQRIEAGADRCDPCRPDKRGIAPEMPRGPGEGTPP